MVVLLQLDKTEKMSKMKNGSVHSAMTRYTKRVLNMGNVCGLFPSCVVPSRCCCDVKRRPAVSGLHAGVWTVALISADTLFSLRPAYSPMKEPSSLKCASSSP